MNYANTTRTGAEMIAMIEKFAKDNNTTTDNIILEFKAACYGDGYGAGRLYLKGFD